MGSKSKRVQTESEATLSIAENSIPSGWLLKSHRHTAGVEIAVFVAVFQALGRSRTFTITLAEGGQNWQAVQSEHIPGGQKQQKIASGQPYEVLNDAFEVMRQLTRQCGTTQTKSQAHGGVLSSTARSSSQAAP
jgi:hypothetical protein